uniref:Matrix protein n=1 Tax=Raton olivaceo morbillivirus TaxID=2928189 RepID=A0A9N6YJY6_9MONO|nr:TPA_asm: matrix protein [Raton olivaceo morbillivirus]
MAHTWDLPPESWDQKGSLIPIQTDTSPDGKLIPKVRVIEPGLGDKRGVGVLYLLLHGVIEDVSLTPIGRTFGAFPLGFGRSHSSPDELLKAVLQLRISVRRTAGSTEKLVFYNTEPLGILTPWRKVLNGGCLFNASHVCNAVECIPLDVPQCFRPVYLTITVLSDSGTYIIPKLIQDIRADGCLSFNLLFTLKVGKNLDTYEQSRSVEAESDKLMTFMIHIGIFKRSRNKVYSGTYCMQKVEKMKLAFALGCVGGVSLHIRVLGKMSKVLQSMLGFRKNVVYPLMYVNSHLNKLLWRTECSIEKVVGVLQPAVPSDFKIYDDIVADVTNLVAIKHG